MKVILILASILGSAGYVFSQSGKTKQAYAVTFHLVDGSTRSGIWLSSSDSSIQFTEDHEIISVHPEQVYKVEIRKANSTKRNAWIGAGAGFVIGFVIGFTSDDAESQPDHIRFGYSAGAGLLGGFTGLFLGHITGMFGNTHRIFGNMDQYKKIQAKLRKYNRVNSP